MVRKDLDLGTLHDDFNKIPENDYSSFFGWDYNLLWDDFPFLFKNNSGYYFTPKLLSLEKSLIYSKGMGMSDYRETLPRHGVEYGVDGDKLHLLFPESFKFHLGDRNLVNVYFKQSEWTQLGITSGWESDVSLGVSYEVNDSKLETFEKEVPIVYFDLKTMGFVLNRKFYNVNDLGEVSLSDSRKIN